MKTHKESNVQRYNDFPTVEITLHNAKRTILAAIDNETERLREIAKGVVEEELSSFNFAECVKAETRKRIELYARQAVESALESVFYSTDVSEAVKQLVKAELLRGNGSSA